jgi:hypothetical protein
MAVSREQVETLRKMLKEAPEVPARSIDVTKQETVRLLMSEIQVLQGRGYSLEQVADIFKGGGLMLTTPTLKSYLSRAKGSRKQRRAGRVMGAGGGAKALARAGATPRVNTSEAVRTEKKAATTATPSRAAEQPRLAGTGGEGNTGEGAPPGAFDGTKIRSGKDAFLTKDKAEY